MDPILFAKAIADETRQEIMQLLCCQWLCVNDVVARLNNTAALNGVTQPTVSHHLAILREAGLVHTRRDGRQVFYSLNQDEVAMCCGCLMRTFAPERSVESMVPETAAPIAAIHVSEMEQVAKQVATENC